MIIEQGKRPSWAIGMSDGEWNSIRRSQGYFYASDFAEQLPRTGHMLRNRREAREQAQRRAERRLYPHAR